MQSVEQSPDDLTEVNVDVHADVHALGCADTDADADADAESSIGTPVTKLGSLPTQASSLLLNNLAVNLRSDHAGSKAKANTRHGLWA